jgi:sirohydrochlorin cobaltochelatase
MTRLFLQSSKTFAEGSERHRLFFQTLLRVSFRKQIARPSTTRSGFSFYITLLSAQRVQMANQVVLAVGHGSRISGAVAQFHQFAGALSERIDRPVDSCFLELADPDLATGLVLAAKKAGDGRQVDVLPVFLGGAGHHKNDVASALRWARSQFPAVRFRYAAPLGFHAKLVDLLDIRVHEAVAEDRSKLPLEETSLLVVGRGSSDPGANSEIARMAYLVGDGRPYLSAEHAFQAVAHPTLEEGLRRCQQAGARQVVVAPFLLFTGRVNNDVVSVTRRSGERFGLRVLNAPYLGAHPLLVEVASQRLQEAIRGRAAVNCDVCKYRFAMPGHEDEVGLPQITHHLHGGTTHEEEHGHSYVHL